MLGMIIDRAAGLAIGSASALARRPARAPVLLPMLLLAGLGWAMAQTAAPREAVLLDVDGAIGPATTDYIGNGLDAAAERNAALVVLRIDTPGGLSSSTRDIVRIILASPVPVVTYVAPGGARAASAGTYILYASHLAAMAPGTNLGAATPVDLGGGGGLPGGQERDPGAEDAGEPTSAEAMRAKVVNDAAAFMRGLADVHGRNAEWAERAVREGVSLSAREALEENVVEIVATGVDDLLEQADGRTVRVLREARVLETGGLAVTAIEPTWRTEILGIITDPNIAYILLLIGIYGIIFEFLTPGTIFSGVIGAICIVVGLFALNLLPINYAGIGLILLGAGLMTAEAFAPSFGILGLGGIVAFAMGSLFLFDTEVPQFSLSWQVIATATVISAGLLIVAGTAAVRAHRRQVVTGDTVLVGREGTVLDWSGTSGEVHVHGERWQASGPPGLARGQIVRIVGREKLALIVDAEPGRSPGGRKP